MPNILCVEDDKIFASILIQALQQAGFEVIHASNGDDGLRHAMLQLPDAIVLDIGLPKKDGFEVLELLKTNETTKDIPVIMLSRLSAKEDVDQCFSLGCSEYLIKSQHSPDDVAHHLRRVLGIG